MIIYCSHSIKHVLAVGNLFLLMLFLMDNLAVLSFFFFWCVNSVNVCCVQSNTDKFILSIQNGFICLKWSIFISS